MNALLYCYRSSVANNVLNVLMSGLFPRHVFTSPEVDADTFKYELLSEVDVAYIVLHGMSFVRGNLFGDNNVVALRAKDINVNVSGLIVVLEGCYGVRTDFPEVFMDHGAKYVIASTEPTYDYRVRIGEAGSICSRILRRILRGRSLNDINIGSFVVFGSGNGGAK